MTATHDAACHCGTIRFRVRGAVAVAVRLADIAFLAGEDNLTLCQFNTQSAKHWFCPTCGICTHHQRRSNPQEFGVNVACLTGVSAFDFAESPVMDGVVHPTDTGDPSRVVGTLCFDPA